MTEQPAPGTATTATPSTAATAAVTPFLMFEGEGGPAMDFYVQAFAPYLPAETTRRYLRDQSHPEELDELADTLSAGGHPLMPPGDYGFSRRFAWVADRWGVTWQLNLA